ncbi:hypothetical protein AB0M72_15660 [Nocardiopsis dassonvillei]
MSDHSPAEHLAQLLGAGSAVGSHTNDELTYRELAKIAEEVADTDHAALVLRALAIGFGLSAQQVARAHGLAPDAYVRTMLGALASVENHR